jgi:hypothetical protein
VGPPSAEARIVDIGKALGTIMSDQVMIAMLQLTFIFKKESIL